MELLTCAQLTEMEEMYLRPVYLTYSVIFCYLKTPKAFKYSSISPPELYTLLFNSKRYWQRDIALSAEQKHSKKMER